jgi:hypothetical protein
MLYLSDFKFSIGQKASEIEAAGAEGPVRGRRSCQGTKVLSGAETKVLSGAEGPVRERRSCQGTKVLSGNEGPVRERRSCQGTKVLRLIHAEEL